MRCFLAVPLREPALHAAQHTLARLREEVDGVGWARPETLHVTVHFFGGIDDAAVARALAVTRPAAGATSPFEVVLDHLGAFPERGRPRVLWLGGRAPNPALDQLAGAVHARLREAGFAVDDRPFRAHCTLGRPRVPWPRPAREAWELAVARGIAPQRFTADRIVLYESVTGRGGAIYTERAPLPLGA